MRRTQGFPQRGFVRASGPRISPLGRFLQSFLDAGFRFEHIQEPEVHDYPYMLALGLRR